MQVIEDATNKIPAFKSGFVIVAKGTKGFLVLTEGNRLTWGERIFGGYSQFFNVDIREKTISFADLEFPSSQVSMKFLVTVDLTVKIDDPKEAVIRGVNDIKVVLENTVKKIVSDCTQKRDIKQSDIAKKDIQNALINFRKSDNENQKEKSGDNKCINIIESFVNISPDEHTLELIRNIDTEELEKESLKAKKHNRDEKINHFLTIIGDEQKLLALSMVKDDEVDFKLALERKLQDIKDEKETAFNILKILIDKNYLEQHDLEKIFAGYFNGDIIKSIIDGSSNNKLLSDSQKTNTKSTTE